MTTTPTTDYDVLVDVVSRHQTIYPTSGHRLAERRCTCKHLYARGESTADHLAAHLTKALADRTEPVFSTIEVIETRTEDDGTFPPVPDTVLINGRPVYLAEERPVVIEDVEVPGHGLVIATVRLIVRELRVGFGRKAARA
ncbi:hypothetical protein SAMN04487781_3204 [Cellulosimicrobium cellulans]|nr:hypothetical protein SAMN04487781_3204 [Cellulosimicrobium cellulans]